MFERLTLSLNGEESFNFENTNFVASVFFEPDGCAQLVISEDKTRLAQGAKLLFPYRGAFVMFLLARLAIWQVSSARSKKLKVKTFVHTMQSELQVPLLLEEVAWRRTKTTRVLRPLSGGETFLRLFFKGLVPFDRPASIGLDLQFHLSAVVKKKKRKKRKKIFNI